MLYKIFWYTSPVSLFVGYAGIENIELSEKEFDSEQYELEEDHAEALAFSRLQKQFPERNIKTIVLSSLG